MPQLLQALARARAPKVEYSLSKDGHEFRMAILPLLRWAAGREGNIQEPCVPGCKRHKAT